MLKEIFKNIDKIKITITIFNHNILLLDSKFGKEYFKLIFVINLILVYYILLLFCKHYLWKKNYTPEYHNYSPSSL